MDIEILAEFSLPNNTGHVLIPCSLSSSISLISARLLVPRIDKKHGR